VSPMHIFTKEGVTRFKSDHDHRLRLHVKQKHSKSSFMLTFKCRSNHILKIEHERLTFELDSYNLKSAVVGVPLSSARRSRGLKKYLFSRQGRKLHFFDKQLQISGRRGYACSTF